MKLLFSNPKLLNMKSFTIFLPVIIFFSLTFLSCSDEEIFNEFIAENTKEEEVDDTDSEDESPATDPEISPLGKISETPCDFTLSSLEANSTTSIDCLMDLNGETVNLASNVSLDFNGGEIVNGTLNFNGGVIDGKLLNHNLSIDGTVELKEETFSFYPERWGIVDGKTTDQKALSNKLNLRKAIDLVHELGGKIFEIGEIDFYVDVQIYLANPKFQAQESILLPSSDFHLKMSGNTHIRVQPNGAPAYNLMSVFEGNNIKITGGNLYGDRWEHDYSPVNDTEGRPRNSHAWGHIIKVQGGTNVLIENVYLANPIGDGFGVHGSSIRNADGTPGESVISKNVTMRNCTIEAARRNGMSILDGDGILIENCQILDTGLGPVEDGSTFGTGGTSPRYGVSFEAYRERTESGELLEYNRIENVTLRGNTFKNNHAGDVVLFTCSNITIEENFFDSRIGNIAANDIIIRNNTMKARIDEDGKPFNYALNLQSNISEWDGEFTYNYTISGNTIEGYGNAMILGGKDFKVFDNKFINNKNALGFENIDGGEFYGNEFTSDVDFSIAYFSRGATLTNVSVTNETINVDYRPINLRSIEARSNDPLTFTNCELISVDQKANFIENSSNISITNNILNTDITVNNSTNINISNNTDPD